MPVHNIIPPMTIVINKASRRPELAKVPAKATLIEVNVTPNMKFLAVL